MQKKRYLYKIYPPRPDFYLAESPVEKKIMADHKQYWEELSSMPHSIVYGPMFEPKGSFALAVIEVYSSAEADDIGLHDPAVVSGGYTFRLTPMVIGRITAIG